MWNARCWAIRMWTYRYWPAGVYTELQYVKVIGSESADNVYGIEMGGLLIGSALDS